MIDQLDPAAAHLPGVWSKRAGAFSGALAALAALTSAEVIGLLLPGQPSIVTSVANIVIDITPASVREALISAVGTLDKPLLALGIVVVIVAAGAAVGVKWRDRAVRAWPVFLLLAAVLAALTATTSVNVVSAVIPCAAGGLVGWAVFAGLLRTEATTSPGEETATGAVQPALSRRNFLVTGGVVGALSVGGIAILAGVRTQTLQAVDKVRSALRLPVPAKTAPPVAPGAAVNVAGMAGPITSNDVFYRIDTALVPPTVDVDGWSLTIGGRVNKQVTLTYSDLMAMPQVQRYVTLTCVSNEVGGDLVGNALWQGVPLGVLLDQAGIGAGADQIVAEAVDGFTAAFPLQLALDGRDPLVAVGMNGEPLPVKHGFPARLVVPGLYGYVSATKWLSAIRLTTMAEETPFWVQRGWIADGRIEAASRIDVPVDSADLPKGENVIAGRAWHQNVAIGRVELSVDDGPWQQAALADSMGIESWRLWSWNWDAPAGDHVLAVRMIDANGDAQSAEKRSPGPAAASGYHTVKVSVSS